MFENHKNSTIIDSAGTEYYSNLKLKKDKASSEPHIGILPCVCKNYPNDNGEKVF